MDGWVVVVALLLFGSVTLALWICGLALWPCGSVARGLPCPSALSLVGSSCSCALGIVGRRALELSYMWLCGSEAL